MAPAHAWSQTSHVTQFKFWVIHVQGPKIHTRFFLSNDDIDYLPLVYCLITVHHFVYLHLAHSHYYSFTEQKRRFCILVILNFKVLFLTYSWTNTRHVCTYLNEFHVVIPNIVMKFNNVVIFWQFCVIFDVSSAHKMLDPSSAHSYRVVKVLKIVIAQFFWQLSLRLLEATCVTIKRSRSSTVRKYSF